MMVIVNVVDTVATVATVATIATIATIATVAIKVRRHYLMNFPLITIKSALYDYP